MFGHNINEEYYFLFPIRVEINVFLWRNISLYYEYSLHYTMCSSQNFNLTLTAQLLPLTSVSVYFMQDVLMEFSASLSTLICLSLITHGN